METLERVISFHRIATPFHDLCVALEGTSRITFSVNTTAIIELYRKGTAKRAQWVAGSLLTQESDWADLLRSAVTLLSARYRMLRYGLSAFIDAEDSYEYSILSVLCEANGIKASKEDLTDILVESEIRLTGFSNRNRYIAQANQCCVYNGEIIERLMPACRPGSINYDVLNAAAYMLKAFAGTEYGEFKSSSVADIDEDVFARFGDKLPEEWRLCVAGWFEEKRMAKLAGDAIVANDINAFYRICGEKQ